MPSVKGPFQRVRDPRLWPLGLLAVAALLLFSGIGTHGFWEPHEIRIADRAQQALAGEADAESEKEEKSARARRDAVSGPPLTDWAVAEGFDRLGENELGGRLPLALLGLVAVMATFLLGWRLATPRAGLLAALILLSSPLFLFQARTLNSEIGALAGSILVALGLVGFARRERHAGCGLALDAADALFLAAGAALCYYGAGAFLGLVVPLGAMVTAGFASFFASYRKGAEAPERPSAPLLITTVLATVLLGAGLAYLAVQVFDVISAFPGERALFGKSFEPVKEYVDSLGGRWRQEGDRRVTFNSLFEQLAFGMFPWSAIAPIAVARLATSRRRSGPLWPGHLVFAWALLGWVVATVMTRKVGPVLYPAVGAIALACGMWADGVLGVILRRHQPQPRAKSESDDETEGEETEGEETEASTRQATRLGWPLAGLFVLLASAVLGKDLAAFPAKLTSLHVAGATVKYPEALSLHIFIPVFGVLFGVALLYALAIAPPSRGDDRRLSRLHERAYRHAHKGVIGAVAIGLLFALFLVFAWTPQLSRKFSSKHIFSVYHELRDPGDVLGILGNLGSGTDYYAGEDPVELDSRADLLDFLGREERVFALSRASELCPVHKAAAKGEFAYHVLDDSHARFLLLSNRLEEGEVDQNPLARAIVRERPKEIQTPLDVNFDDKVRLIGVDMPRRIDRGDKFEMTLYFKVLERVRRNWKIFVHFDGGGMRFQGDHDPIQGRCGTAYWQPGDFIVDTFEVEAGTLTHPKTNYRAWAGFFVGSHGNWTNMEAKSDDADGNNRVPLGVLEVR